MINDNLKKNIDQSVDILRRYHLNAVERNFVSAKTDIEIIMTTIQDLCKLVFDNKKCTWKLDDKDEGIYSTSCEKYFTFFEDGIKENDFVFCCYCGCEIKEIKE